MISPELLREHTWFATLSSQMLKAIALISAEHPTEAEEVLFREGDPARYLMFVLEGSVDIVFESHTGERFIVDTVGPGEPFCWSSLVEPYEETATAVVREPGRLIRIGGRELRDLCDADHQIGYLVMQQVATVLRQRLQSARVQLIGMPERTL